MLVDVLLYQTDLCLISELKNYLPAERLTIKITEGFPLIVLVIYKENILEIENVGI